MFRRSLLAWMWPVLNNYRTIQILPMALANQIAAGEVIERPASCIKELLENSLDAGATEIHIDIDAGGLRQMVITDNGSGIEKQDLLLSLAAHATSKIQSHQDLFHLTTLGFRGEALASIQAVSKVEIISKRPGAESKAYKLVAYTDMPIRTLDTVSDGIGYLRDMYNSINKLQGMMPYSEIVNNLDLVKDSINSTKYKLLFLK